MRRRTSRGSRCLAWTSSRRRSRRCSAAGGCVTLNPPGDGGGPAYCTVAVDSPVRALDRPLDYLIPERMRGALRVGSIVRVPVHGRRMRAYVVDLPARPAVPDPKPVSQLVSPEPVFSSEAVGLARWAAQRYLAPLGLVLHQAVPGRYSLPEASGSKRRARARTDPPERPSWLPAAAARANPVPGVTAVRPFAVRAPSVAQERELAGWLAGRDGARGGQTLVVAARVHLAEAIADSIPGAEVVHGEMTPRRRAGVWARAALGRTSVVVGGRSALFVPLPHLRTVVVTAAHDFALKDERWPRIHGFRAALERARLSGASFVTTSCAPPLDVFGPDIGVDQVVEPVRGRRRVRPEVTGRAPDPVGSHLLDVVRSATGSGVDALVFAHRRGVASRVTCRECGWYPRCAACGSAFALVESDGRRGLLCRTCHATGSIGTRCAQCGGRDIAEVGWGTERLAARLRGHLAAPVVVIESGRPVELPPPPAVFVATASAASVLARRPPGAVCVADLDQVLGLPDYRSGERAYQTLAELAALVVPGGRFLVQTREADHHAVQAFTRDSYRWFADRELARRRAAGYPPYGALVRVELPPDAAPDLTRSIGNAAHVLGPLTRPDGSTAALVRAARLEDVAGPLREFAARHQGSRIDIDPIDVL